MENVLDKLKIANTSDEIIHVIDSTDYKSNNVLSASSTGLWKFAVANVTDFAFATE